MEGRIRAFDVARGFSVASMVLFHFCYDLKYICGFGLDWFAPPFMDIWRASISWTFLFVAGCMCSLSRNNLHRALRYGAVALGVFVVTSFASVDTPISFGIIYCMAASTLLQWVLERFGITPKGHVAALILLACFLLLLGLGSGRVGIGALTIELPRSLYSTELLAWLGIPGPGFSSGDYYPLLPFALLFLSGSSIGWWWKETRFPSVLYSVSCRPFEWLGKQALPIYVLHQPALLLICQAIMRFA